MSFSSSIVSPSLSPLQNLKRDKATVSSSTLSQGGSIPLKIKPLSLPSLASITANLLSNIPSAEQSQFGPHRTAPMGISSGRRFSPLSNGVDYNDSLSPLDSEHPTSTFGDGRPSVSGISMIIASSHRPRSRSFLSGSSLVGSFTESDVHADESASDSGSSDKKHEDNDPLSLSKKRSRTLTTPSQQRRLAQVLEQTRFPSTDVREQLARELGMTPRRVQIWFQNRRQGMKKALEHKPDHETSTAPTSNSHASRGFSFEACPTPPEMYTQSGLHPLSQPKFIPSVQPAHNANPICPSKTSDSVDGQEDLCSPRSTSGGVPRNMHLELSSDNSAIANRETGGGLVSDFMWSDPLTAGSLYSSSSLTDKEANFSPFSKLNSHLGSDSNSQTLLSVSTSRLRSQTNPDLFGIMNGFMGFPGPGLMSSEFIDPFQQISHIDSQRALFNGCNLSISKNDMWSSSYSPATSNWHDSLEPLKLETSSYTSDQSLNHLHANSNNSTEMSAGFYYPSRKQETIMEDNIAFSTLQLDHEAEYLPSAINGDEEQDSLLSPQRVALLAQHHLRQRSQSLNSSA